ncbi:hypothetical protein Tco_0917191 [Tanacetum coccineum]
MEVDTSYPIEDTSSSNEVNTANNVSTALGHNSQGQASSSSYTDDLMGLMVYKNSGLYTSTNWIEVGRWYIYEDSYAGREKVPTDQELLEKMLNLQLEAEEESTMAILT